MTGQSIDHDGQALSLYYEALKEAERHKWIESQKLGRDLGRAAISQWYQLFWNPYCRSRRLEHVQGQQFWVEFETDHFGLLDIGLVKQDLLTDRILDRAYCGYENLEIINWALDWNMPLDRVIEILSQIDVNRARLDPEFDDADHMQPVSISSPR